MGDNNVKVPMKVCLDGNCPTFVRTQTYQKILVTLVGTLCLISAIGVQIMWNFKETYSTEYRVVIAILEKQKELNEKVKNLNSNLTKYADVQRELEIYVHEQLPRN